jgi:1-acyl-sn-glycerol-3-phosphate acyltransferase
MQPSTLKAILRFLFDQVTVHVATGAENFPRQGAYLLATNHMSRLDLPLLFIDTPRPDLIALVANSYKRTPFLNWIVRASGSIWIDRDKADFAAMRAGMDHLRAGGVLGIAPEGTRSRMGSLLEAKTGVALIAEKAQVPVIPVALEGTESCMRQLVSLRRPHLWVHFGAPFTLPPLDRKDRDGWLQRCTDEIMCRIAAMLPSRYHGFYANHPRLKELLSEAPTPAAGVTSRPHLKLNSAGGG